MIAPENNILKFETLLSEIKSNRHVQATVPVQTRSAESSPLVKLVKWSAIPIESGYLK